MPTVEEVLALARQHRQAGNFSQAEYLYRQILLAHPGHADAHHLLGLLAFQRGQFDLAAAEIRQALALNPTNPIYHCNLGLTLTRLGQLDDAVAHFQQAIALRPDFAEAHNNLGIARKDQGRLDDAAASYGRALRINPHFAEAYSNLGDSLRLQGRLAEAVVACQQALRLNPQISQAQSNMGIALKQLGRMDEAVACFQQAVFLDPNFADAHNYLGEAYRDQGRLDQAVACYRQVARINPHLAAAHNNLGNALKELGRLDEAMACFQQAMRINPNIAEVHNNVGNALVSLGRLKDAMACYHQALRINPNYANVHYNLGNVLMGMGQLAEAVAYFQRSLEINPQSAKTHNNLATALKEQGRLRDAVAHYQEALRINPDMAEAHFNLGNALKLQNKSTEALACYRRAVQLCPHYPAALGELIQQLQHVCLWEELEHLAQQLLGACLGEAPTVMDDAVSPFNVMALPVPTTPAQQLQAASRWVERYFKTATLAGPKLALTRPQRGDSKITLGYLSSDFHAHATTYLIAELFEKHDRERFNVFGYSYGPDTATPIRLGLVRSFDRFADVRDLSFEEAARRIAADGVDILIDLKGYTTNTRTEILALRPAPIQVNYLGYPGTMAAPFIDYILVDDFVVPPDQQPYYTEKLVHLPGCYQVNDSRREIAAHTPSRAECGLPEHGFIFCCFNNNYKITPALFDVWMRLLKAVPDSVLWLYTGNLLAPANLRQQAEARGVAPERLVFAPFRELAGHLARHRLADLFLDTFPVNAHTTASDALWAGCPVLTIAGQTFIARVAGSLLRTLGLPELITTSLAEYEALALRLAKDSDLLAELRTRLAANRKTSRLFDAARFARSVEKAYDTMWEMHAAGEKPRGFAVAAD